MRQLRRLFPRTAGAAVILEPRLVARADDGGTSRGLDRSWGERTEVRAVRQRIESVLQTLADGAIWLLFKGNRVRS
jgi:hypothetical protein